MHVVRRKEGVQVDFNINKTCPTVIAVVSVGRERFDWSDGQVLWTYDTSLYAHFKQ